MSKLEGSTAIISGGLGAIGQAIAQDLAREGASIAVGDIRDPLEAEGLLKRIEKLGRRFRYDQVDVADAQGVEDWVSAVERDLGVPDLIVANAAIVTVREICALTPTEWSHELSVNLNGVFHLAQAGAKRLIAHGKPGRIVFIGSWTADAPHPRVSAYCTAKAGLRMLCRCLALELAPKGILVNEVALGYVDGGLTARRFKEDPQLRADAIEWVPTHQLIDPDEVAAQVTHCCDPQNRHMTGTVLLVDGGLSLTSVSSGRRKKRG